MSLNFADIPQTGGGFFKPKEELGKSVAYLIEPKRYEHQRPTKFGPKDTIFADVTIFRSEASLDSGTPDEVHKGMGIEQTLLARDLNAVGVGNATIVKLGQTQPKTPGQSPAWVWQRVDQATRDKVVKYATDREAAVQAALASAPSFD